jgi:hypothetical protein
MQNECIKKPFSADDADKEILELEEEFPQCKWWAELCESCHQYHIQREGTTFVKDW